MNEIKMDKKIFVSRVLLVGGIVELIVAVFHYFMPIQLLLLGEIKNLSDPYRNFVALGIIAIGLCLMVFGCLSIYFSRKIFKDTQSAWTFGMSQGILWTVRAIFEMVFPVRIPMLYLSNPTVLFLPLIIALALIYFVPLIVYRKALLSNETKTPNS